MTESRLPGTTVFSGGPVFGAPERSAVAIRDGLITWVGPDGELPSFDHRIDLEGRMLLPGFQDAHIHPAMAGLTRLRCDLEPAVDLEDALDIVARHAESGSGWLVGGGWRYRWFPDGNAPSELLDAITDRPVWLVVADGHSGWANQAALRLAGIDAMTADPSDGVIVRAADGRPQGTLHEGAMALMERVVPPDSDADVRAALLESQTYLLSLGITAWQDAWVTPQIDAAYRTLAENGSMRCRVRGALWWDRDRDLDQLDEIVERSSMSVGGYVPKTVKLMLDGVCENFTASMLEPYRLADGGTGDNRGIDFIDPERLPDIVTAIDAAGLQTHFHALGDRAVRNALDAIEAARRINGARDSRPHLAHIQVIHPDDIPRFAALGATANMQPLWACSDTAMTDLTIPFLPAASVARQYPFASLHTVGARLAMGSDWSVSTPDVFQQAGVAVTRTRPERGVTEPFLPDERLSVTTTLTAVTAGSAYVNFLDHDSGRIERGLRADLVVASGDPFTDDLFGLEVDMTVLDGGVAYER